jgi:peroxiredoxin Q/BCP
MKLPKPAAALALALLAAAAPALAALKPGDAAPTFKAPAYLAGEPFTFDLAEALSRGPVVVYFFPAAHTPGCNLEAGLFSKAIDRFEAAGVSVVGVTAGNVDELADFSKETEHCAGKFPVAADPGATIAAEYDAVMARKPEWSDRTSYLIAPTGKIVAVHSDPNPNLHVKSMLDAAEALAR